MNTSGRIFGLLVWMGGIAVTGAIALMIAASRIGEHKSSTYGYAYHQFQKSWGGEIEILPPEFFLERNFAATVFDSVTKKDKLITRTERVALIPEAIKIDSRVHYDEKNIGFLKFNAFNTVCVETYKLRNQTGYSGKLLIDLKTARNANIMYDYEISLPQYEMAEYQPQMNKSLLLLPEFKIQQELDVVVTYSTKGMDVFKYNLSEYRNYVINELHANFDLNTRDFEVYRFGIPHEIESTAKGARIKFRVDDFATTQDLGVVFESRQIYLDQVQDMVSYAPLSLALFMLVVFVFSQIRAVRFHSFHYLFLASIHVFYFLFVAYLTRFFDIRTTLGIAVVLTAMMFLCYCPRVLGWRFAGRVAGPYLFLLTIVYSTIFLLPIFRGLSFVLLLFLIFMSLMIAISRSNISEWQIVKGS
ncbi:hypothetical protein HUU40_29675 [candidate division KSB1 bacterium]|nr:hypothetical protein [candidate division KSB1 bacterium]